tara:strand:+ start:2280 stop:3797 length:1518 start_codon:yes stop_codon:yes gene_type:complete
VAIKGLNFNIGNISSAKIKGGGLSNAAKFKPSILKLNTDQLTTNVGLIDDIISLEKRADNAEKITSSLMETNHILAEIQQQLALDFGNRIVEQNEENKKLEKESSQQKFKEEEENIEKNRKKSERKLGESAKKVVAPIQGIFGKIFNFIKTITGGIAVDFAFNWLKDDKNKEKLEGWFGFIKDHWKWIVGALGVAAVAQIIGPLAGVFNIVTAAVPLIIGAVKLFASPLGLKVLAAVALGVLAFKGGKWIINELAGGNVNAEFDKQLREQAKAAGIDVKNFGTGALVLGPDGNPITVPLFGKNSLTGRKAVLGKENKNAQDTLNLIDERHRDYIRRNMGEEKLAEMDAAYKKYMEMMQFKDSLLAERKLEIQKSNKEIEAQYTQRPFNPIEGFKLNQKILKEKEEANNKIKEKYNQKLINKFPQFFNKQAQNLNLTKNDKNVSKKVTPSSKGEGTITFQNLPGVTTGANVPLGGGGVATQVSNISSKNNGDPYRLLTPSIYGIFV